jgi:hypothetical protein
MSAALIPAIRNPDIVSAALVGASPAAVSTVILPDRPA